MFEKNDDFYIKIDDVNSDTNSNQTFNSETSEIPDYNSPEYAEYISKKNREDLKEINQEESNKSLENKIKEKFSNKQMQLIVLFVLIILFFAIVLVGNSMYKGIVETDTTTNTLNISNDKNSEFKFLVEVVTLSGDNSVKNYDKVKELIINAKTMSTIQYQANLQDIKDNAINNLNDVNSLSNYIDTSNYKKIIILLKTRYEEMITMCDKLSNNDVSKNISTYNEYALSESERVDEINNAVVKKAKSLKVDYEIKDNKIVLNIQ